MSKVCEVTYVNHLVKGEGWESLSDLANLMAGWKFRGDSRSGPPRRPVASDGLAH